MQLFYGVLSPNELCVSGDFVRHFQPESPFKERDEEILIVAFSDVYFNFFVIVFLREYYFSNG